MNFTGLAWLFVVAVAIHNTEEAIWLPEWSQTAGRWEHRVDKREFRFAATILTILAAGTVLLAEWEGKRSIGAYLLCGYALAMLINVAVPHVLATLILRRYAPGTASAVLFNLPLTMLLIRAALAEGYISVGEFIWAGPIVVLVIIATIPLLLWAGRATLGTG